MRFSCNNIFKNKSKGFTLVEIIVVIGIMAVLSGIIFTSFDGAKSRSRDQQRVADISTIQLALEIYFNREKKYPLELISSSERDPDGFTINDHFTLPTPPRSSDTYNYFPMTRIVDDTRCVSYHLWTKLENGGSFLDSKKGFDSTAETLSNNLYECGENHPTVDASSDSLIYDVTP